MAINRATQNWPDVQTIVVVNGGTNPFVHELNAEGTGCAHDCDACMFIELNYLDIMEQSQYAEPVEEMERRTR